MPASHHESSHRGSLSRRDFTKVLGAVPFAFGSSSWHPEHEDVPAPSALPPSARHVTLLYTNDFHSAFAPVPAFWLKGAPRLGGAAQLAALVEQERATAHTSFLLDSGDMFTGALSRLTEGEALLEMMLVMRYDAMGAGNHEFDYGWKVFDKGMARVPFPILCCNIRHRGTGIRFTRAHTILERNGVRLGVIGVMGMKAATRTIMPSKVAELEFTDPVAETQASIRALRGQVDAIICLAHQGLPGAMQSDAENDPAVQRSLDEDLAFCGAVPGIDVYIAAHSHHGLERPIVHADTGTIVTQTFGYGTRLGRIRLALDGGKVVGHEVDLLKVWSDRLTPHAAVASRVAAYRAKVVDQVGPPVGRAARRFIRKYHFESPLGAFACDVMRAKAQSDVALFNAGGLRADLMEGPVDRERVLDAFPFPNDSVTLMLPGGALRSVLEQGCSLEAGMVQASGLRATYDPRRPAGSRVLEVRVGDAPLDPERLYRVTTNSFLSEGGDGYAGFLQGQVVGRDSVISELVLDHVRRAGVVDLPVMGRMVPRPS